MPWFLQTWQTIIFNNNNCNNNIVIYMIITINHNSNKNYEFTKFKSDNQRYLKKYKKRIFSMQL